jgi:hypothetical protein
LLWNPAFGFVVLWFLLCLLNVNCTRVLFANGVIGEALEGV